MTEGKKKERAKRLAYFKDEWLPAIKREFRVDERENGSYSFFFPDYGPIDFYPKSDRILFRSTNDWIGSGMEWIIERFNKM